eukprot:12047048-Prorocentrum_lima.AAC.2
MSDGQESTEDITMSDGQEPELSYYGYDDSFDAARSATKCFNEKKLLPKETAVPTCSRCGRQQR